MGAARKYAVIDSAAGKLDRRIFSDRAVYDDEMPKADPRQISGDYADRRAKEVVDRATKWLAAQSGIEAMTISSDGTVTYTAGFPNEVDAVEIPVVLKEISELENTSAPLF